MSETKGGATVMQVQMAAKTHRPIPDIEGDLAAAEDKISKQRKHCEEHELRRRNALARRERLEGAWRKENPNEPFDPSLYSPPANVPPQDTPEARAYHQQAYVIAALRKELEEAKAAASMF